MPTAPARPMSPLSGSAATQLPPAPLPETELSPTLAVHHNHNNSFFDDKQVVVLEDVLSKQGSRSKNFWHDRYFVLTADGTLRYYKKKPETAAAASTNNNNNSKDNNNSNNKDTASPKASLVLNRLPDCEVSELYVAKPSSKKTALLYCVKITWSALSAADVSDAESEGGGTVLLSPGGGGGTGGALDDVDATSVVLGEDEPLLKDAPTAVAVASAPTATTTTTKKKKKSLFRKSKKKDKKDKDSSKHDEGGEAAGATPNAGGSQQQQQPPLPPASPTKEHKNVFRTPPRDNVSRRFVRRGNSFPSSNNNNNNNQQQPPPNAAPPTTTTPLSVDGESLTVTNHNPLPTNNSAAANATTTTPTNLHHSVSGDDFEGVPAIPEMVEVQEVAPAESSSNSNNNRDGSAAAAAGDAGETGRTSSSHAHHRSHSRSESFRMSEVSRQSSAISSSNNNGQQSQTQQQQPGYSRLIASQRSHEEDSQDEMEYLRNQFLATEKEKKRMTKRKVADGAKVAAAAGAAVGIAVVTVGIGLVAGLVALGVGAAAGASGTATGLAWKKKKEGQVVIGSPDYEQMRRWKACLDAALNSGIVQKSKWGQAFLSGSNDPEGRNNKRRMLIFPKAAVGDLGHAGHHHHKTLSSDHILLPFPSPDSASLPHQHGPMFSERTVHATWKPLEGGWTTFLGTGPQGLRIFQEEIPPPPEEEESVSQRRRKKLLFRHYQSVDGRPCPPMKAHLVLNATPLDAFLCLMSHGQLLPETTTTTMGDNDTTPLSPNSGQRSSFRIIESIDDNTDVIHLVCNPLYLFPSWTSPRDFVLYRYWRLEEDGSFIICYESVQHKSCPPYPGYCRGEMHQVFTIAPHKKTLRRKGGSSSRDQLHECLMTAVVQVDPKGWVPIAPLNLLSNQGYGDAFSVAALIQLLDIRDAIDQDRFVPVSFDDGLAFQTSTAAANTAMDPKFASTVTNNIPRIDSMGSDPPFNEDLVNYDFSFANRERVGSKVESSSGLTVSPPPLVAEQWAEPDPNSFRVRGQLYKEDRKKINAGASIGRLVAVDVVQVDAPIYSGMTTHPTERVQLALQKEAILKEKGLESDSDLPAFLFVVNIVLPGPPFYHGVFYYAIDDMSKIDGSDGTPSSLLCKEFLFGDSDSFRDKTFKLIPQIVQGNFIVRKAVGSTPAIMGKKLKQTYVRTERSLEVVLDCGSSPVATGVIRLSLGYAKTLVVDMGFLFEGDSEEHLPERLMGCARIRQLDFGPKLRKVEQPPPEPETQTTAASSTTNATQASQ